MLKRLMHFSAFKLALLIGLGFAMFQYVWRAAAPEVFPFGEVGFLDDKALDFKFKRRGPIASSGQVVIAGVDEASLQRYGLWPWKRELIGRALKNLDDAGAAAIGVDIFFPDPDRNSAHLTVNRVLQDAADRLSGQAQPAAGEVAPQPAPALLRGKDGARAVCDATASEQVARVRGLLESRMLRDPDEVFADYLRESPHVVLGVSNLQQEELKQVLPEVVARDTALLERFMLVELYREEQTKVFSKDGALLGWDWGPVKAGVSSLSPRALRTDAAVQAPLPVLAEALHGLGAINTEEDSDGTIRRYPLVRRVGEKMVPSLALQTAALVLGARIAPIKSYASVGSLDYVGLMKGELPGGLRTLIPVSHATGMYLTNYPGKFDANGPDGKPLYQRLSLADAVDGRFDPALVKGKVVLVGTTAPGTFDQRVTPFDSFVPGVYTHAAVIDNVLTGSFFVTHGMEVVEVAVLLVLAVLFGLLIPRMRMQWQLLFMLGLAAGYVAVDFMLFRRGIVLTTVVPLFEIAVLSFSMIVYAWVAVDREKRQVRTAFQFYLTKSVMEEMLKDPGKLKLGGDKRELTVLFSDIRGFTTISEKLPPEELVRTLNEYLTPMTNLVFKHQGTLDKYMGDAIMAIWGAPLPQEDHALRACRAAVEMLEALDAMRAEWRKQGRPDIDIGIGINSGPMAVGNMGSDMRFDYTVMGDNVNLGSRLEGTNKQYGTRIIISEFTYAQVKGRVAARELGSVKVKGKKKPVMIYELRSVGVPGPEEAKSIAAFEKGMAAYRARSWDEAEVCLHEVLQAWPGDGPSLHYLDDIAEKRLHPPEEGWDGVYEMKTK